MLKLPASTTWRSRGHDRAASTRRAVPPTLAPITFAGSFAARDTPPSAARCTTASTSA